MFHVDSLDPPRGSSGYTGHPTATWGERESSSSFSALGPFPVPSRRLPGWFDEVNPNLSFPGPGSFAFQVDSACLAWGVPKFTLFLGVLGRGLPMRSTAPAASFLEPFFLMRMSCLSVCLFPGFGVPVPRGCLAALGEVPRRGAVLGPHHLPVDISL
eukprot:scaffold801_cov381-Pavlova_lutheri.AAC.4